MLWSDVRVCRYQCDGFFTGAAPPWYDSAQPASVVTAVQQQFSEEVSNSSADRASVPVTSKLRRVLLCCVGMHVTCWVGIDADHFESTDADVLCACGCDVY